MHEELQGWARLKHQLRKNLISGLAVLVPLVITAGVFHFVFGVVARLLLPMLSRIFGQIPQYVLAPVSVVLVLLIILLVGSVATHVAVRRMIHLGESILDYVPFAKTIYGSSKKVLDMLLISDRAVLKEVALIDYPYKGIKMLGFVSGSVTSVDGRRYFKIFMPTTPNPTSGFLHLVPEEDAVLLDMSIEDAVKFIVSAGMLSPQEFRRREDTTAGPPDSGTLCDDEKVSAAVGTLQGGGINIAPQLQDAPASIADELARLRGASVE